MNTISVSTSDGIDLPIARDPSLESAIRQTLCIQLDMGFEDLDDVGGKVVYCWNHPTLETLQAALEECLGDRNILIIHIES